MQDIMVFINENEALLKISGQDTCNWFCYVQFFIIPKIKNISKTFCFVKLQLENGLDNRCFYSEFTK